MSAVKHSVRLAIACVFSMAWIGLAGANDFRVISDLSPCDVCGSLGTVYGWPS